MCKYPKYKNIYINHHVQKLKKKREISHQSKEFKINNPE